MTDINKEDLFRRSYGLLRMISDAEPAEKENAARKFASSWTQSAAESNATMGELINWISANDSTFLNEQGGVDTDAVKTFVVTAVETGKTLSEGPGYTTAYGAITSSINAYYFSIEHKEEFEARRTAILDVIALRKEAKNFVAQAQHDLARTYEDKARRAKEGYDLSEDEIEELDLARDEAMLKMFENIRMWKSVSEPGLKSELENDVQVTAAQFGLMKDYDGVSDFTNEFKEALEAFEKDEAGYTQAVKEKIDAAKRKKEPAPRVTPTATPAGGIPPFTTTTSYQGYMPRYQKPATRYYGAAAGRRPGPNPMNVTMYPLEDTQGKSLGQIGGHDILGSIARVMNHKKEISLAQTFPMDGLQFTDKDLIDIRQDGDIKKWFLGSTKKISWRTSNPAAALNTSTFYAEEVDIELGATEKLEAHVENSGTITANGPMRHAVIEFLDEGSLVINDLFENSKFYGKGALSRMSLENETSLAIGSSFIGKLPLITQLEEEILTKEYTKPKIENLLSSIERAMTASFSLGKPGHDLDTNAWSPAFYSPHVIHGLSDAELSAFNYLLSLADMGYEGQAVKFLTEKAITDKFLGGQASAGLGGILFDFLSSKRGFADRFCTLDNTSGWKEFVEHSHKDQKSVGLIVNPLFPSAADFDQFPLGRTEARDYYYRLTFFTGSATDVQIGEVSSIKLSPSYPDLGHTRGHFRKLNSVLSKNRGRTFSIDICVNPSLTQNFAVGVTSDMVPTTLDLYKELRGNDLRKLFDETTALRFSRWSTPEPGSLFRDKFVESASVFDTKGYYALPQEDMDAYKEALVSLAFLAPSSRMGTSPSIVDGKYFKDCTFSGDFGQVVMRDFPASSFEEFSATNLIMSGNWNVTDFVDCTIVGSTKGAVLLNDGEVKSTDLTFTGAESPTFEACRLTVQRSSLSFDRYDALSMQHGHFSNTNVTIANSGKVDLGRSEFKDCEFHIANVQELNATNAKFINCEIIFEGKANIDDLVNLSGAVLQNTTIALNGGKLNLSNAAIMGKSRIEGAVKTVVADGAQLGSGITSRDISDWMLAPEEMSAKGMKMGNLCIHFADAFGKNVDDAFWHELTILGSPMIMPEAQNIFGGLKKAKNCKTTQAPLRPDGVVPDAIGFSI